MHTKSYLTKLLAALPGAIREEVSSAEWVHRDLDLTSLDPTVIDRSTLDTTTSIVLSFDQLKEADAR